MQTRGRRVTLGLLLVLVIVLLGVGILIVREPYLIPLLRYQFADIEDYQIFASRSVEAGDPQPWRVADRYNDARLDAALLDQIERYNPVAYLVIQNGEIVYERYWGAHTETSYSASFSMAKSIVSLLIGIALEEGRIESLDQPVADFIPEFRGDDRAAITFRHLLTMTSGLTWDEAYTSPFSPTAKLYYGADLYAQMVGLPLRHEPGTVWYYSSADTQILGMALEAAVGQPLSSYASEKLWQPLGAEQDASWSLDREGGTTKGNCCFNSTARDFARLGQLVLQGGRWNDAQLVPEDYLRTATQPIETLRDEQGNPVDYYGYQFWIFPFEGQRVPLFAGILGQYIIAIPDRDAVVVRLGRLEGDNFIDTAIYLEAAAAILDQLE